MGRLLGASVVLHDANSAGALVERTPLPEERSFSAAMALGIRKLNMEPRRDFSGLNLIHRGDTWRRINASIK